MDDVVPLAELFVERYGQTMGRAGLGLSAMAKAALTNHPWPGNVRELENAVQRALLMADGNTIEPEHLELKIPPGFAIPQASTPTSTAVDAPNRPESGVDIKNGANFALNTPVEMASLETVEREHILRVLKSTGGNRKKAIDILGISERALRYKLKDYREQGFYSD